MRNVARILFVSTIVLSTSGLASAGQFCDRLNYVWNSSSNSGGSNSSFGRAQSVINGFKQLRSNPVYNNLVNAWDASKFKDAYTQCQALVGRNMASADKCNSLNSFFTDLDSAVRDYNSYKSQGLSGYGKKPANTKDIDGAHSYIYDLNNAIISSSGSVSSYNLQQAHGLACPKY